MTEPFLREFVPTPDQTWLINEIRLTAALAYFPEEFEMVMGMMAASRVVVGPLHTSTVGLGDQVEPRGVAQARGEQGAHHLF